MGKILKFGFNLKQNETAIKVNAPVGSEVLHVAQQNDQICIWLNVPQVVGAEKEDLNFQLFPTGDTVPRYAKHIGSVVCDEQLGFLVFHAFEV